MSSVTLWIGRAEVRPLEGADCELEGATGAWLVVFAYAGSRREFERELDQFLREGGVELIEVEDAGPAHEMLDIDEMKMLQLLQAAETGQAAGVFFSHSLNHKREDACANWSRVHDEPGSAACV